MSIRVGAVLAVVIAATAPARASVTVFLERNGFVTEDGVEIPKFGGGDRAWHAVVTCVRTQYAAFAVDIVDHKPTNGSFITAVVGGRASLLGLDDRTTNGVGPFDGNVEPDAVVYVFSRVGTGERDVENLCAVTAHEVGHALGLDHEIYCGDVMSYYLDRCGARKFVDAQAPCGETERRRCATGESGQNSYRRLGALVGFRDGGVSEPGLHDPDEPDMTEPGLHDPDEPDMTEPDTARPGMDSTPPDFDTWSDMNGDGPDTDDFVRPDDDDAPLRGDELYVPPTHHRRHHRATRSSRGSARAARSS